MYVGHMFLAQLISRYSEQQPIFDLIQDVWLRDEMAMVYLGCLASTLSSVIRLCSTFASLQSVDA